MTKIVQSIIIGASILATTLGVGYLQYKDVNLGKNYDYYMDYPIGDETAITGTIVRPDTLSRNLVHLLQTAKKGDTITIHLAGFGGDGELMDYIISAMHNSKAKVITSVEAPCYSAHAYIAAASDNLRMAPNTFLMFHTFSGYGYDCSKITGLDRGHSAEKKCEQQLQKLTEQSNKTIESLKILTSYEKQGLEAGYDVYLTDTEVSARQKSMNNATVEPIVRDPIGDQAIKDLEKIMSKTGANESISSFPNTDLNKF